MPIKLASLDSFSSSLSLWRLTSSYAASKETIIQVTSRSSASERESLKWTISKLANYHLPDLQQCFKRIALGDIDPQKTRWYHLEEGKLYDPLKSRNSMQKSMYVKYIEWVNTMKTILCTGIMPVLVLVGLLFPSSYLLQ